MLKIRTKPPKTKQEYIRELLKPKKMSFSLLYEPKFVTMINDRLNFKNYDSTKKIPPLFTLVSKPEKEGEQQQMVKNMKLVKLAIRCMECDFESKLSVNHLDKLMRQRKEMKINSAVEHYQNTKHKMMVKQKFEEWRKV